MCAILIFNCHGIYKEKISQYKRGISADRKVRFTNLRALKKKRKKNQFPKRNHERRLPERSRACAPRRSFQMTEASLFLCIRQRLLLSKDERHCSKPLLEPSLFLGCAPKPTTEDWQGPWCIPVISVWFLPLCDQFSDHMTPAHVWPRKGESRKTVVRGDSSRKLYGRRCPCD